MARHGDAAVAMHIDLYCDDPKAAEIALINLGVDYDVGARDRTAANAEVLTLGRPARPLGRAGSPAPARPRRPARRAKPDARGRTAR